MKLLVTFSNGQSVRVAGRTEAKCLDLADTAIRKRIGKDVLLPRVSDIHRLFESVDDMYDAITQVYFQDERSKFQSADINDHPLLKLIAHYLDDAIVISRQEGTSVNDLMYNFLQVEIDLFNRFQRLFK